MEKGLHEEVKRTHKKRHIRRGKYMKKSESIYKTIRENRTEWGEGYAQRRREDPMVLAERIHQKIRELLG